MNTARQHQILAWLKERGSVRTAEVREKFGVTAMTAWRDLACLAEQGLLRRVRGGALRPEGAAGEEGFETKSSEAEQAKSLIAARAVAEFVRAGDVIALEGGTTVAAMVPFLPKERISVVTNSLPVAVRLRQERAGLPVTMPGGWVSAVSGNLCGPDAVKRLALIESSACFISATGFDAKRGPMDPNPLEIEAKRALAERARRVVLLMEGSKWKRTSTCVTLHPRRIHVVVTNAPPPPAAAAVLRAHGVRVMRV